MSETEIWQRASSPVGDSRQDAATTAAEAGGAVRWRRWGRGFEIEPNG